MLYISMKIGFIDNAFTIRKVDDRLYTGKPLLSPFVTRQMKRMGVTQVIDLRIYEPWKRLYERTLCALFGIKYVNFKVPKQSDKIPGAETFKKINNLITSNPGVSYLHCKFGQHRTGMCVAAYEKDVLKKDPLHIYVSLANRFFNNVPFDSTSFIRRLRSIFDNFSNRYIYNDVENVQL